MKCQHASWKPQDYKAEKGEDAVMAYKRLTGMSQQQFNDEIFDAYRRFITWDLQRVEKAFEITTAPAQMDAVREALAAARVPIIEAQVTYVPQSTVRVEGKDAASVVKLIEALEELDDVQSVYANYDIPDEVLEAISAA